MTALLSSSRPKLLGASRPAPTVAPSSPSFSIPGCTAFSKLLHEPAATTGSRHGHCVENCDARTRNLGDQEGMSMTTVNEPARQEFEIADRDSELESAHMVPRRPGVLLALGDLQTQTEL